MSIVAVMNRKGGSGRSTLAVHIAAWCAHQGERVVLGDTDKQLSTLAWLGRRSPTAAHISPWSSEAGSSLWLMEGHQRVVVDTPGGVHGLELAKHLARVDAVVMPVGPSLFDLETSTDFFQDVLRHPRVVSGRCQVAVVGMRWPLELAALWASGDGPRPFQMLTVIPEAQTYRAALDLGSSLFDEEAHATAGDLQHWQPLLDWLERLPTPPVPTEPRLPAGDRASSRSRELRSPASFIETQPPFNVYNEEPDMAERAVQRRSVLTTGKHEAARKTQSDLLLTLAPKPHGGGRRAPDSSWLKKLFKLG